MLYIYDIVDVEVDGNFGFRIIAYLHGYGENVIYLCLLTYLPLIKILILRYFF